MRLVVLIFMVCSIFTLYLHAQEQTGGITGEIFLKNSYPVEGVKVEVTGSRLAGSIQSFSDENGKFRFFSLPPGKYALKFFYRGFKKIYLKGVKLQAGEVIKTRIRMEAGGIKDEIKLKPVTAILDVENSSLSFHLNRNAVKFIPKDRGQDVVSPGTIGVNLKNDNQISLTSLNGTDLSENNFFVDGMNTNSGEDGLPGQQIVYDWIEEVQIKSSGHSAEFSGAGGSISVITKGGSNRFDGNISLYYEPENLKGRPSKPLLLNPEDRSRPWYPPVPGNDGGRFEGGISFGGYFLKDRIWFFFSMIPGYQSINQPSRFKDRIDKNGAMFSQENIWYRGSAKLTASLWKGARLTVSSVSSGKVKDGKLPDISGRNFYDNTSSLNRWGKTDRSITLSGNLDYTLNNNVFLNLNGGYFRTNSYYSGKKPNSGTRMVHNNYRRIDFPYFPGYSEVYEGTWNMSYDQFLKERRNINERISLRGDCTFYPDESGKHLIKGGLMWRQVAIDKFTETPADNWAIYWRDSNNNKVYIDALGDINNIYQSLSRSHYHSIKGDLSVNRWAFYLQDNWSINKKLTLNIGLRFEKEGDPVLKGSGLSSKSGFDFLDKISPRVGFAYDIHGDGKNKLFGSWGIYYDVMKLSRSLRTLGAEDLRVAYYNSFDYEWQKVLQIKSILWGGIVFPQFLAYLMDVQDRIKPAQASIQPDLKPFSKMEFAFGYQKALGEEIFLTTRFLFHRIINTVDDIGVNVGGEEVRFIGNPGSGWLNSQILGQKDVNAVYPKPRREFYSLEFSLEKRFSDNWMGGISVILSRLWGDYTGDCHQNYSSEGSFQGYSGFLFTRTYGGGKPLTGRLPMDRPFQGKFYGAYSFNFGLTVGINGFFISGTPVSRTLNINGFNNYLWDGRHTDGGTPFLWQIDLYLEHTVKIDESINLSFMVNITNLTNNRIGVSKFTSININPLFLTNSEISAGISSHQLMEQKGSEWDPRFMMDSEFQEPVKFMFGMKLNF